MKNHLDPLGLVKDSSSLGNSSAWGWENGVVKKIWLLFMLEGQKEGIPEQPAQSITGMVLVPLGTEVSILSSGRHGVGRAGLTGKSLALFRVRASGNMSGSLVGAHGARQGGQCWARVFSSCSFPAGRSTSGGICLGAAPQREGWIPGAGFGLSLRLSRCLRTNRL